MSERPLNDVLKELTHGRVTRQERLWQVIQKKQTFAVGLREVLREALDINANGETLVSLGAAINSMDDEVNRLMKEFESL